MSKPSEELPRWRREFGMWATCVFLVIAGPTTFLGKLFAGGYSDSAVMLREGAGVAAISCIGVLASFGLVQLTRRLGARTGR